jgi:hypothetical protein
MALEGMLYVLAEGKSILSLGTWPGLLAVPIFHPAFMVGRLGSYYPAPGMSFLGVLYNLDAML